MSDDKIKDRGEAQGGGEADEVETLRQRVEEGIERLVPEVIKRTLEAGFDTLSRTERGRLRGLVGELRVPRDVSRYFLAQIDDTKNALLRVFANEVHDFLENTDIAEDLRKVLTSVSLEVSTQIRFIPNEAGITGLKADVAHKTKSSEKRSSRKRFRDGDEDA